MHYVASIPSLDRLKEGDFKVFELIFNTYWEELYIYASKVLGSQEDAQDLVQELFTSLWERRESIAIQTEVRYYLFSAARKLILRRFRDEGLKEKHLEKFVEYSELRSTLSHIQVEDRDLLKHFNDDLQQLPEKERQVFKMYHFEELSIREIADRSGTAEQTVRNQLGNAYKKARPLLHRLLMTL
ncbi:RNA polymerase sigma-70 factor (ECF subfamily) [Chitinophaga terrae (ex Kim and Jung 2007)]|jgi:RNA polymerase sigma-70 factor (ECF subfamily)|uniref:RNA polymerase sigma-70 factor n=1 Tax=Chitinophaga terrae (ex Kim and Jung 2007) TaxID=408074 RepID=UPI00278B7085|nr:RNA polymerase sigma-70 factor [Chitinophaga terrae (ex Kim and Jung 2007)]MDQ0109948.1 RNA polymerase sigma-70 factor (ECF subfamily) [Chitinophaga terrae (ex Kim and Jung 2007)]